MAVRRSSVDSARKCIWVKAAINQRDLHTPKYHRVKRSIRISDAGAPAHGKELLFR